MICHVALRNIQFTLQGELIVTFCFLYNEYVCTLMVAPSRYRIYSKSENVINRKVHVSVGSWQCLMVK